jgi:F-type H+-transporting ATPase subunit gamma
MANRRVLVKRRKAVRNIRKITRTMQLIATARFQATFNRAVASRPFTEKLAEIVGDLARGAEGIDHPLLKSQNPAAPAALLVLTSNRGLCGGYNASVLRLAHDRLAELRAAGRERELHAYGKKGISYFRFIREAMATQNGTLPDMPRYEQIEPIASELIEAFLAGRVSEVTVAYTRFYSASRQRPEVVQLLPLADAAEAPALESAAAGQTRTKRSIEYEFRPEPAKLLSELLPATVRIRLFQAFLDAAVSEQISRMVAMKAATEAAEETIKTLTRQYNRARQTHITMELLDIVGGSNALA